MRGLSPSLAAALAVLTIWLFLWPAGLVAASESGDCHDSPVLVYPSNDKVDLSACLWYLEDPDGQLTLYEARQKQRLGAFKKHHGGILNLGFTESAFWVRMDIQLDALQPKDKVLELRLPLVDETRLHVFRDGRLAGTQELRYDTFWHGRELRVPNPVYKLTLNPGETVRLYLRIETVNTFRLPLTLWSPDAYLAQVAVDEIIQGGFLGMMLAMLAYNLFVALSMRERTNVYYVFYLIFGVLFVLSEQVHGQQLFDSRPWLLDKSLLHYHILLTWFFGLQMARNLLELRERSPQLDRALQVGLASVVATLLITPAMSYHSAMEWVVIGSMALALLMLVVSLLSWRYYNPAARSYFFAWAAVMAGVGVYALTVTGVLPLNSATAHAPQIGLSLQLVLFSFALADRIKLVQAEALNWNQRAVANLRRYRSLFNNAVEGIFQMSLDRRFITVNPALAGMLDFPSPTRMRRTVRDALSLFFPDPEQRADAIDHLEAEGLVKGMETWCQTGDGQRWVCLSLSISTVYDEQGEPSHLEGTCVDITERKQRDDMEKERENERLEKDIARSSAEAKSQFLANMSHEIRTPLAAIIGYGESLLDSRASEEEKRLSADTVVRSGRHLLDLVNDILDHSKIDANKLSVEVVTVNLPDLLNEVRAFFAPRAHAKGIEFEVHCDYPLPETIQTDPTRLRQIIINLCGNALKFTEKGSINLFVRCDRNDQQLQIRVVDTGIGMTDEQMGRLFDPFAQGGADVTRHYGGTGLGLSITRRLAELLGGEVDVSSVYGEGSEFLVTVSTGPLEEVHWLRDRSEWAQRNRVAAVTAAPQLRGRILCAEDNEVNRQLVRLLIERTGAEAVFVNNGAEAFDKATREHWDLILMDIQMPVMNGRDATAAIRKAGVNTPVIALTANVMSEDIEDYRRAGCTDHIAKPIDRQRFYETLARYLTLEHWPTMAEGHSYRGTVLVVEDHDDNRNLVSRLLERFGLEVIAVESGREAVRTALAENVHLVLMDRHLPGMSGTEATRMLRQTGFRRPVIAFTAGDQAEIDELMEAGCDSVLTKPIDNAHLAEMLDRFLVDQRVTGESDDRGPDGIDRLIRHFRESLPERLRALDQAREDEDWQAMQRQAHQIKGTAGAMGFPDLTSGAGELDRALRNGDYDQAISILETLRPMLEQVMVKEEDN